MVIYSLLFASTQLPFKFDVQFEMVPNLIYQLDAVSGTVSHHRSKNFSNLWEKEFLKTADDREALANWKVVRNKSLGQSMTQPEIFPIYPVRLQNNKDTQVRVAGLTSKTLSEYTRKLARTTESADAKALSSIAHRFAGRFQQWWESEATVNGQAFFEKTQKLVLRESVQATIAKFVNFYQPILVKDAVVPVQLIYKPNAVRENNSGEQVAEVATIEFRKGENPADRIDVTVHELCHFFYGSADPAKQKRLQRDFLALKGRKGLPVFNVSNEALATTLGNGMLISSMMESKDFEDYMNQPMSWYGVHEIDGAAKASFPWLRKYVEEGGTLFTPGFAEKYVDVVRQGLGKIAEAPIMMLMSHTLASGDEWSDDTRYGMSGTLRASYYESYKEASVVAALRKALKDGSQRNLLVLLKPTEVSLIAQDSQVPKDEVASILSSQKQKGYAAYSRELNNGRRIFLVVASTDAAVQEASQALANCKQRLDGLLR